MRGEHRMDFIRKERTPTQVPALFDLHVLCQVKDAGAWVRFLRTAGGQKGAGMGTAPQATLGL